MLKRTFRFLDTAFCVSAPILLACMVIAIILEISLREIASPLLGNPKWISTLSSPINTLSQTLLVWTGLIGGSVALKHRAHLGVDALTTHYPAKVRFWLDRFSIVLVGVFSAAVCIYGGAILCQGSIRRGSVMPGFENINRAWFYSVLILAGLGNLAYCVWHLRKTADVDQPALAAAREASD